MTIKARVELIGSFTHNSHWRKFRKGSPQILTNPSEIQYYQNQYGFDVVLLDSETKEKVVKEVIKKVKSKSKTKVNDDVVKSEENEAEEEHYEDEECEEREDDEEYEEDDEEYEEEDEEEEEEEDTGYTEGMLKDFKKSQLKSLANDLELDIEGTKKELMARIIDATNQS
jgi:hypothetical protein